MLDTGICVPESVETLKIQQSQLMRGKRVAQMFPIGTTELNLPVGFERHVNARGVFHFNPATFSKDLIDALSSIGRENAFLNLGPYSKNEIAHRVAKGEKVTCISEFTPSGVEVRCAAATDKTLPEQAAYFESTKEDGNVILKDVLPVRVLAQLTKGKM